MVGGWIFRALNVSARLASGVLPKQLPTRRWAGYRSSRKWDGCELRIYAHEIRSVELDTDGAVLRRTRPEKLDRFEVEDFASRGLG